MGYAALGKVNGYWLGGPTRFRCAPAQTVDGDPDNDPIVYRRSLTGGGEVSATEAGLIFFDFTGLDREPTQSDLDKAPFDTPTAKAASIVGPRRVELLNAHQLCLIHAIGFRGDQDDYWFQEPRPVSIRTLFTVSQGHRWSEVGIPGAGEYGLFVARRQQASATFFLEPVDTLDAAASAFEQVRAVSRGPRACHGLLHALDHYRHWRNDQALIMAWTTCEVMLDSMWEKHFTAAAVSAGQKLNNERKSRLTGAEFTSSIVLESLALAGLITQDLYDALTRARGARNKWAHSLDRVSPKAASDAILGGFELLASTTGVTMDLPVMHSAPHL